MDEKLRKMAEEILKKKGGIDKKLYTNDLESLVEELSIFQIELEHQNQELRNSQVELLRSKDRFANLFNTAPVGYFIINDEHQITDVNITAAQMLNKNKEDFLDLRFEKLIHPNYQDIFHFHVKLMNNSNIPVNCDIKLKKFAKQNDDLEQYFFARLVSMKDDLDEQIQYRIAVIDITSEKSLELKLIRAKDNAEMNKRRWEFAFDGSGFGLWDWDLEKNEIFYSSQWKKVLGYGNDEIGVSPGEWKNRVHPHDLIKVEEELDKLLKGKSEKIEIDYRMMDKHKKYLWIHSTAKIMTYINRKPVRIIGTHEDISEKKRMEQIAEQHHRLSAIKQLSEGIAHDFNNEVQIILSSVEVALRDEMSEKHKVLLESIKKSSILASARIRQLQRYSGNYVRVSEYEPIDLKLFLETTVEHTKTLWKALPNKKGIVIDLEVDFEENITVCLDQSEFQNAIFDILKNCVDALPNGGKITLKSYKKDDKAHILITDNGSGIDNANHETIFQPFYSSGDLDRNKGMGLSHVHAIINESDGQISVKDSSQADGTTLEIVLPVCDDKLLQETEATDKKLNVLWVDDEKAIVKLGERLIKALGHNVSTAMNGTEALQVFNEHSFDIVISDLGMPDMNGWHLAERIYNIKPEQKIVILTGWGNSVKPPQDLNARILKVISKPVTVTDIKKLLDRI